MQWHLSGQLRDEQPDVRGWCLRRETGNEGRIRRVHRELERTGRLRSKSDLPQRGWFHSTLHGRAALRRLFKREFRLLRQALPGSARCERRFRCESNRMP